MADGNDPRTALKKTIVTTFNQVAPNAGKIVSVNDVVSNFSNLEGNNLGFFERAAVDPKIKSMLANSGTARGPGIFEGPAGPDGKPTLYIQSSFVQQGLARSIDRGDADGHEGTMQNVGLTAAQAIKAAPDRSDMLKAGTIKPKM